MRRSSWSGDRAGPRLRAAALVAAALVTSVQLAVANTPASYASDATPSGSSLSASSTQAPASSTPPYSSTSPAAVPSRTTAPVRIRPPRNGAAAASPYLALTANSLDAVGLTYVGVFTVSRPSGDVDVLRFTLTGGSIAGLMFTQACESGGATTVTSAPSASLGGTTFDAVSLTVTVGGQTVTFTVADPPSAPFPSEFLLQDLALTGTVLSTDQLSTPSFTTEAATC